MENAELELCKCGAKLAVLSDEEGFSLECSDPYCGWYIAISTHLDTESEYNTLLETARKIRGREIGN